MGVEFDALQLREIFTAAADLGLGGALGVQQEAGVHPGIALG
jgi:hypothetical protein